MTKGGFKNQVRLSFPNTIIPLNCSINYKTHSGMKSRIKLSLIGLLFPALLLNAQSTDSFLNGLNNQINSFYQLRPHDNVYVHTDRSVYFPGENMQLRIFVADAANLMASERSDKCHVILLSQEGAEVISASFELVRGNSNGTFLLPGGLETGVYSLVAYVMKGDMITTNKVFNKELIIANPSEHLMMDYEFDREIYKPGDAVTIAINIYGHRSRGLAGVKVDARLKDEDQEFEEMQGKTSREGSLVFTLSIPRETAGDLSLVISAKKRKASLAYNVGIPMEADIPEVDPARKEKPVAISGKIVSGSQLKITANPSASGLDLDTKIVLALFRKGLIYWSAPGELKQVTELIIPLSRVPSGILDVVMFNLDGDVLGEEMIYYERTDMPGLNLETDRDIYGMRQQVKVNLELQGRTRADLDQSYFSVSVVHKDLLSPNEMMLDEKMLIDVDLLQDTRRWLGPAKGARQDEMVDHMLEVLDRNGYSWDLVTGKSGVISEQEEDEAFDEEIMVEQYFPNWFEANHMHDFEDGIMDARHPDSDELFYVKQLENGTPVLDVIKSIKPFTMQGNKIIFPGTNNSINFQQGALIVIDNVQMGEDASVLRTISPNQVESINISTNPSDIHKYTGLNVVGVIEITMKGYAPGSRLNEDKPRDELVRSAYGKYLPGYPDYSIEDDQQSVRLDHRSLLYWEPGMKLKSDETLSFDFYTPDLPGTYVITVQGMLGTVPLSVQKSFTVK